jgi:hypothetical protein
LKPGRCAGGGHARHSGDGEGIYRGGLSGQQAAALAVALRQAQYVDFSSVATKADLIETRADICKVMLAQMGGH